MRSAVLAAAAAIACLVSAGAAWASPVATDDATYSTLGRVFPDPMAGCKAAGTSPCDPNADGRVPAAQFIGVDEFNQAITYMNSEPQWRRYMEVWALDGKLGNGEANKYNNRPLEFDPKPQYVSAGLPTTGTGRRKSDLVLVRVTDERVPDRGKKRYTLSLSIHGIERAGAEGGTRAMEDFVTAATQGRSNRPVVPGAVKRGAPTFAEVLKKTIIYFTYPNPDGWRRGSVSSGPGGGVFFQRYNGNGVDPNRDWPDIGFSFRPYSAVSEPETHAWKAFYDDVKRKTRDRFDAGDDLHGMLTADALSYTLLPHGSHRYGKNNRIQETAKRINRATYHAIKWSPIVQENNAPEEGGPPCAPDAGTGPACARIYGQTWGTVYDTINYTTTGALGDWFDSSIGLGADGINNEMAFSHLDKNIVFDPHTEQLHVEGNKALIFGHVAELLRPTYKRRFDARGRMGYVANQRLRRGSSTAFPTAPRGTSPQSEINANVPAPGSASKEFRVERTRSIYNGGLRVEVTNGNIGGIGTGSVTLKVQCKGCDRHPGVKDDGDWVTVGEDYNQSPAYLQAGVTATVNDPQANGPNGKPIAWRALVEGPTGVVRFRIAFTRGPASVSGNTGGGPPPRQSGYNVANTDFFRHLNGFRPGRKLDFKSIDPKKVIRGKQKLNRYDTIALADNALPGYSGVFGRRTPRGPATKSFKMGDSTSTGDSTERPFTIGANDANAQAAVRIQWENPVDDFDLNVYYVEGKHRTLVGRQADGPPEDSDETVIVSDPDPGRYVVEVENASASNPSWTGSLSFKRLPRTTGRYSDSQRVKWMRKLRAWVRGGGNLVLTDRAMRGLKELTPLRRGSLNRTSVYAGQAAFATGDDAPTTKDRLARGVVQLGARFNSGFRRQMYEPTPLGFAIQDEDGSDASYSPQWDVDRGNWQAIGGRTVATSVDSSPSSADAVFTRVTIGELKLGKGRIRTAGALLPQPTERFDHEFGLEPYAVTYTGYVIARNLLDAGRVRKIREPGKSTARGRFVISRRAVKVRRGRIAPVRVRCIHRRGCRGRLRIRVVKRLRQGRDRGKLRLVQIATKRFHVKKRRGAVIRLRLTLEGRRLVRRNERLRIRASAKVRFGDGRAGVARRRFWLVR